MHEKGVGRAVPPLGCDGQKMRETLLRRCREFVRWPRAAVSRHAGASRRQGSPVRTHTILWACGLAIFPCAPNAAGSDSLQLPPTGVPAAMKEIRFGLEKIELLPEGADPSTIPDVQKACLPLETSGRCSARSLTQCGDSVRRLFDRLVQGPPSEDPLTQAYRAAALSNLGNALTRLAHFDDGARCSAGSRADGERRAHLILTPDLRHGEVVPDRPLEIGTTYAVVARRGGATGARRNAASENDSDTPRESFSWAARTNRHHRDQVAQQRTGVWRRRTWRTKQPGWNLRDPHLTAKRKVPERTPVELRPEPPARRKLDCVDPDDRCTPTDAGLPQQGPGNSLSTNRP